MGRCWGLGVLAGLALVAGRGHDPSSAATHSRVPLAAPGRASTGGAFLFTGGGTPGPWRGRGVLAAIPGGRIAFGDGNLLQVDQGGAWHTTRLPASSVVESLVFSSPTHGFAYAQHVGSGPLTIDVYQTENGGTTWHRVSAFHPGSPGPLESLLAVPGGYVGTASLNFEAEPLLAPLPVEESADGVHWHQLSPLPASFLPIGAAEGPGNTLWLSGTLGQSQGQLGWVNGAGFHPVLTTSAPLSDMAFSGSFGLAIGGVPSFKGAPANRATQLTYSTTDGGRQWELAGSMPHVPASFSQLYLVSSTIAYATAGQVPQGSNAQGYQALYRTTDGGRSWTMVLSAPIDSVAVTSPTNVDVSTSGVLWQSQNAGRTWQPLQPSLFRADWVETSPTDPSQAWAVVSTGMSHLLVETTNAGRTWTALRTLDQNTLVSWFSRGVGVLETSQATLVAANGTQTRPIPLPSGSSGFTEAAFTSPARGWLLANSTYGPTALYRTDNAGAAWTQTPVPVTNGNVLALRGPDIAVLGGDVAVSTDGGRHWYQHTVSGGSIIFDAAAWNHGTLWVFGTQGITPPTPVAWTWAQGQWIRHPVDVAVQSVSLTRTQGWAASATGNLYHSTDGGTAWHRVPFDVTSPIVATAP